MVNSVLSKIKTQLITIRMTEITERENMLQDNQFGFRKKRATEDAILIFNTVLTEAKLRKIDLYLSFVNPKLMIMYPNWPCSISF